MDSNFIVKQHGCCFDTARKFILSSCMNYRNSYMRTSAEINKRKALLMFQYILSQNQISELNNYFPNSQKATALAAATFSESTP